jgi:hypothetical protein
LRITVAKAPSQRKLDTLRREWQKRLHLLDWKISCKFTDLEFLKEITKTEAPIGACEHFAETKEAKIWVLRPQDWQEEKDEREQDVEDTVVHELLHCQFAPFRYETEMERLYTEQTIETLTAAMLELKRQK